MTENNGTKITWRVEKRRLADLAPWGDNPRRSTKKQAERIQVSLEKFGYSQLLEIEPDNILVDGHQRDPVMMLMQEYGPDAEIEVRVCNRKLTRQERKEYIVMKHQGAVGEWDWDKMQDVYTWDELRDWGFSEGEIKIENWDQYTRKIEAPIYRPTGPKPELSELFDDTRTLELIVEIDASELPEAEKEFLRIAARRHTVINYKLVAEYYAHSSAQVQKYFEDSALVIIDFNRAIELGYVKLAEEVAKLYGADYGDEA
jgi:hypothetical protein